MTREEFLDFVYRNKINSRYYSLDGQLKEDAFHLRKGNIGWGVFYFERGKEYHKVGFPSEENALEYLYQIFLDGINNYGSKAFPD